MHHLADLITIITLTYSGRVFNRVRLSLLALTSAALLASCTTAPASPSASPTPEGPLVVATTTHLGSIVDDIAVCAGGRSETLMGPGDDPHDFALSSSQVAQLVRAHLVVASGLGLEGGMTSALEGAVRDGATLFEVAPLLDPIPFEEDGHDDHDHADDDHPEGDHHDEAEVEHSEGDHDGHDHGPLDPHVHMDVARMAKAAKLIGDKVAAETGQSAWADCGTKVEASLMETDAEVRSILDAIPAERRVLLTDHDAYRYFAKAYGFEVVGVVIQGGSTDAEPSSAELAKLVDVIREHAVPAIFSNNTVNPRTVEMLAAEAGTDVKVVALYEGSVGPAGSDAATYSGMMLANARLIAAALA